MVKKRKKARHTGEPQFFFLNPSKGTRPRKNPKDFDEINQRAATAAHR